MTHDLDGKGEMLDLAEKARQLAARNNDRRRLGLPSKQLMMEPEQFLAVVKYCDGNRLPPLNDELIDILGRPNFVCAPIAQVMRQFLGHKIERKAEHEQAAVIHWLLRLYISHGDQWRAKANEILKAAVDTTVNSIDEQANRVE